MSDDKFPKIKSQLDKVSPTFCLAKWTQVTLHLHQGLTHSCHHPAPHKIPLNEIAAEPSALHNTHFKREQRKLMKSGKRPSECDYCWNIEDSEKPYLSDRYSKSDEPWSREDIERIKSSDPTRSINPRYVEVSFSNGCNFKCSYCSPVYSSSWVKELNDCGSYQNHSESFNSFESFQASDSKPIPHNQENPYVDAFWKWWPDLIEDLRVFRITGGEPLMSPETFKVFEKILSGPERDLSLAINSNLGIKESLFEKSLQAIKKITESGKIKEFTLFTSVEAWNNKAEYIRSGLDFDTFWKRLDQILNEAPKCRVVLMCTYNALSASSFTELLKGVVKLKKAHANKYRGSMAPYVDIPYLRHPRHQSVGILPREYVSYLDESLHFMLKNNDMSDNDQPGFYADESASMERAIEWFKKTIPEDELLRQRSDFYQFFSQHDSRRGTDFLKTFPEMEGFWNLCKSSSEAYLANKN